ncbi:MAG: hypothetical protein IIX14_08120 [Clostridia bacterium]|nr:hypothetical protein [Clostridia bacterium]
MSYCVNCGVELDASATKCVLCDTPVYNPHEKKEEKIVAPFSDISVVPQNMKKKFAALIITYIILIPNIVCALINIFLSPEKLWFIFMGSSSLLFWVVFIFPFLSKKLHPYRMWAFDTVAVALYTFVFHSQNFGGDKWYFGIALPIILITSACVLAFIHWDRKRKHHWTSKVLHIFVDLVITLSVASLCFFVNNRIIGAEVCVIIDACCLALLFFWLYANKSKKVRAWLSRKVFV